MKKTKVILITDSNGFNSEELRNSLIENNFELVRQINIKKENYSHNDSDNFIVLVCQFHTIHKAYVEAISDLVRANPCPIILFTSDNRTDSINHCVKAGVNAYIIDGFNSQRIKSIIEIAISRFHNYQSIVIELQKTKQLLVDRKLIEEAKGILMKSKDMDEEQAYKAMRKMAMDKGKTIAEISRSLINVMEMIF